jgi:sugar phosphate isomerase/epimerase
MKIGFGNHYVNKYGVELGATKMAEDGYTHIDYNFANTDIELYTARDESFLLKVTSLRRALDKAGLKVEQIHGPWQYPPKDSTDDERAERFEKMTKAMVIARYLGAKYMAVHPLMPYGANSPENPEGVYEINRQFFAALANVGKNLGVTVCLENMPFNKHPIHSTEQICALVRDIDHPNLKVCFDTGHANCIGEGISESVKLIGKELLKIIHVHDNYGDKDSHNAPYDGTVDWSEFIEALYEIGYDGVMNLEVKIPSDLTEEQIREAELSLLKTAKLFAGE